MPISSTISSSHWQALPGCLAIYYISRLKSGCRIDRHQLEAFCKPLRCLQEEVYREMHYSDINNKEHSCCEIIKSQGLCTYKSGS